MKKVVFTNGCFDMIHCGHLALLKTAREFGDELIVGLNSDASIRELKGPDRPILNQDERRMMLLAIRWVDRVIIFDSTSPLKTILRVHPHVLVKGGDWNFTSIIGAEEVEGWGGQVAIIGLEPQYSTTSLIERIKSRP